MEKEKRKSKGVRKGIRTNKAKLRKEKQKAQDLLTHLTPNQDRVLKYCVSHIKTYHQMPTLRQIGEHLSRWHTQINSILESLIHKEFITRNTEKKLFLNREKLEIRYLLGEYEDIKIRKRK